MTIRATQKIRYLTLFLELGRIEGLEFIRVVGPAEDTERE